MKIAVCYIAVTHGGMTRDYCARFVTTYHEFPAGAPHELVVLCNGGPLPLDITILFSGSDAKMFVRENDPGFDISAYMDFARQTDADIMVCLGESVYFHRKGWLLRLVEAWGKYGPGMYGPFSSNNVRSHLGTTAFCCHPSMLLSYPFLVRSGPARYEFEHGDGALWRRLARRNIPVRLVTWDGEWEPRYWRMPPNIMYRGNQSNCLMWCNHSDGFANATPRRKASWAATADQMFR